MRVVLLAFLAGALSVGQLSAPVFANAGTSTSTTGQASAAPSTSGFSDPHWRFDADAKCWVYLPWPEPQTAHITWSGACENQLASGTGIVTSTHIDGAKNVVTGNFAHGQLEGKGTFMGADGLHVEGEFEGGLLNGLGEWTMLHGLHYVGQFVNTAFEGQGTAVWPNGDRYVGLFQIGLESGLGAYTFADGQTIEGNFDLGQPVGHAALTRKNGRRLAGELVAPRFDPAFPMIRPDVSNAVQTAGAAILFVLRIDVGPDGIVRDPMLLFPSGSPLVQDKLLEAVRQWRMLPATLNGVPVEYPLTEFYEIGVARNGSRYVGMVRNREYEGDGVYTQTDGQKYEGQFAKGHFNGEGKIIWGDGDMYKGTFRDGSPFGNGVYSCKDGRVYQGTFIGGKVWGHAILHKPDGTTLEGEFAPARPDPMHPLADAVYPETERRLGQQGMVQVRFLVEPDGSVSNVRVINSSGNSDFDLAAIQATQQSHMLPGTLNGQPVEIDDEREFVFKMQGS